MTPNTSLERRLRDHYASEPQLRAPDRVLLSALATIETTRQRRGLLAPWRFPDMNNYAKVAAAAAVVIALGAVALVALPKTPLPGSGGTPTASPTAAPSPAISTAPSPTIPAQAPTAPPLTGTFTSSVHGIELSYPEGWTVQKATKPWPSGADLDWTFGDPNVDFIVDPILDDRMFLGLASQPLGAETEAEWIDRMLAMVDPEPCADVAAVTVDGAEGSLATCDDPIRAFVSDGVRGYAIFLYRGDGVPEGVYELEFFQDILGSIQLHPRDAAAVGRTTG